MIKRHWITGLKIAVTITAILFLFGSGRLRLSDLRVAEGGWIWIAAAALMCLLFMSLSQVRYWAILRGGGVRPGFGRVMQVGFIAWFFNAALLGGIGFLSGDAIKAAYLMRGSQQKTAIVGATLLDRVIGVLGLLTLAVFAIQVSWESTVVSAEWRRAIALFYGLFAALGLATLLSFVALTWGRFTAVAAWLIVGGVSCFWLARVLESVPIALAWSAFSLAAALAAPAFLPGGKFHQTLDRLGRPGKVLSDLVATLMEYRKRPLTLGIAWLFSGMIHFLWMSGVYFAARAIVIPVTPAFRQVWFAAPPANATNILPLPASGLGVGETAFDALLRFCAGPDGAPIAGGAAIYLAFRIVMTLTGLCGAPVYLLSAKPERPKAKTA